MKTKLTLQEKLRDLRNDRKLKLAEVSEATDIPTSTLQRFESDENARVGYQDIETLMKFYGVSADYIFGLTDNKQYRNIEIDAIRLSDAAIETLKGGELNNRLVSELLAHPDFPKLLSAVEVYIDRKVLPQMNTMNAMYKIAESTIKKNFEIADNDETIALLQEAIVDEDEYLRYRISERFNALMKKMFDAHKKDDLPDEQASALLEIKDSLTEYPIHKEKEERARWQLTLLAKQIGLNITELDDEELRSLMKALNKSSKYKQGRKRK